MKACMTTDPIPHACVSHYFLPRGSTYDGFSGLCFRSFEIIVFCFIVALFDLVHDVNAIHGVCLPLTTSGNLF